jgi:hypothetical protein
MKNHVASVADYNRKFPLIRRSGDRMLLDLPAAIADPAHRDAHVIVLSIIGRARGGKSTFLNALARRTVFEMSDNEDACTKGVDVAVFTPDELGLDLGAAAATTRVLLMDCRWLGYYEESATVEPALLKAVYSLSDLVVFNQSEVLSNDILQALQPLALLQTSGDVRPHLMVRLKDVRVTMADPQKSMDEFLRKRNDQYDSLRGALAAMFASCSVAVSRYPGDLPMEEMPQSDKFRDAINVVYAKLRQIGGESGRLRTAHRWCAAAQSLTSVTEGDLERLDGYGSQVMNDIRDYLEKHDSSLTTALSVSGTAEDERAIAARQASIDRLMSAVQQHFNRVDKGVLDKCIKKRREVLEKHVCEATAENIRLGKEEIRRRRVSGAQWDEIMTTDGTVPQVERAVDQWVERVCSEIDMRAVREFKKQVALERTKMTAYVTEAHKKILAKKAELKFAFAKLGDKIEERLKQRLDRFPDDTGQMWQLLQSSVDALGAELIDKMVHDEYPKVMEGVMTVQVRFTPSREGGFLSWTECPYVIDVPAELRTYLGKRLGRRRAETVGIRTKQLEEIVFVFPGVEKDAAISRLCQNGCSFETHKWETPGQVYVVAVISGSPAAEMIERVSLHVDHLVESLGVECTLTAIHHQQPAAQDLATSLFQPEKQRLLQVQLASLLRSKCCLLYP